MTDTGRIELREPPPGSPVRSLSVLISTHDRAELLERTIRFLNEATRPTGWNVNILVVANACSDRTHAFLSNYVAQGSTGAFQDRKPGLDLRWVAEPAIGKSHAQNRAIPMLASEWVAFIDDDHRVDASYLVAVCDAVTKYPAADIFCGRILPDWDGTEPAWVHDTGEYRIYPLPVPRYDLGNAPHASPQDTAIPGGGNIVVKVQLFRRVGGFSTDYGPVGDNLGGAEDREWIERAIMAGAQLQYVPDILQYHYADPARLTLRYLVRKAFERSASVVRLAAVNAGDATMPSYMIAKTARRLALTLLSLDARKRRFQIVRLAAAAGEIRGRLQAREDLKPRVPGARSRGY